MGKRATAAAVPESLQHSSTPHGRTIRKRKRKSSSTGSNAKAARINCPEYWHENDDEDSSNDAPPPARNRSNKHANNSSILINISLNNTVTGGDCSSVIESPKPIYTLRPSLVNGTVLHDLTKKSWRLGKPIGKGNFGEIFLATDKINVLPTNENSKYVVKIEPHSNGPLFVEIHCLINAAKAKPKDDSDDDNCNEQQQQQLAIPKGPPSGIPDYIASGSHYFGNAKYRFFVLPRFDRDLHSLIKNCRVHQKSVLILAVHILTVLQNLHDRGYCHNDVKAQNLMISKCKYRINGAAAASGGDGGLKAINSKYGKYYEPDEKQHTTDSGNSSEQEANDDDEEFVIKRSKYNDYEDEDEDFDDGATTNSNNSNSVDQYHTPVNRPRKNRGRNSVVMYSGSNPVRSCRRQQRNSIYEEMVKSHYLRPNKHISYSKFYDEDQYAADNAVGHIDPSDAETEEFLPQKSRQSSKKQSSSSKYTTRTATRLQDKSVHPSSEGIEERIVEEERIFLIDYGLASKFRDNGVHRPFIMDQRRAHDGTLEFTSRDAHLGAHSRRSDLECLGYNLIFWSQGYLPWKEAAAQHQEEKVHGAKEHLMADVREMLKQVYGKQVPKYLGEFLHYVGQLKYNEDPDYAKCKRIFEREFQQLGYPVSQMKLNSEEIQRTCIRFKEDIENKKNLFDMKQQNNGRSIMNASVGTPFQERTLSNRVSPKNLRSKSDKKQLKKKKQSWIEILSQDPDSIVHERTMKELEDEMEERRQMPRRYEGKPTKAILDLMEGRSQQNGSIESDDENNSEQEDEEEEEEEEVGDDEEEEIDDHSEELNDECTDEEEQEEEVKDNEDESADDGDESENEKDDNDDDDGEESNTEENDTDNDSEISHKNQLRSARPQRRGRKPKKISNSVSNQKQTAGRREKKISQQCENKTKPAVANTQKIRKSNRATRCTYKGAAMIAAASAAGENEHHALRHTTENGQRHGSAYGGVLHVGVEKVSERRTRRCLIKTDGMESMEDDSNSNFGPEIRGLCNIWSKYDNEALYLRNSRTVMAGGIGRYCKK